MKICINIPFFLMLGCIISCNRVSDEAPNVRHVIIIGVDALSSTGIRKATTSTFDQLMQEGAYTMDARCVMPSESFSNWSSMIMGAGPESTGLTTGNYDFENPELPPVVYGNEYPYFPTIFSVIKSQRPDSEVGAVYQWSGFESLFEKSQVDFYLSGETKEETAEKAINYILGSHPLYTFVHFDNVDIAGHVYGYESDAYYKAIHQTDSLVGTIVHAMKEAKMLNESLVIICSDHGGFGYSHGGRSEKEMIVPFILYGKGVKKNYPIEVPVSIIDNAPTVAFALGIEQPYVWTGRPIKSAFIGNHTPALTYTRKNTAQKPVIFPDENNYEPAGGLFIDSLPIVTMENPNPFGHIRYTTDGTSPQPDSPLYEETFRLDRTTIIKAAIFNYENDKISRGQYAYFRVLTERADHGLRYRCYQKAYDNTTSRIMVKPDDLFDLEKIEPVSSGITYDFSRQGINCPDMLDQLTLVTFDGWLDIQNQGRYTFTSIGVSNLKFYVDDMEVLSGGDGHTESSGFVDLEKGRHEVHAEWIIRPTPKYRKFFEFGRPLHKNGLVIYYQGGDDIPKQLIPPDVLYLNEM